MWDHHITVYRGEDSTYSVRVSVLVFSTAFNERVEINCKLFVNVLLPLTTSVVICSDRKKKQTNKTSVVNFYLSTFKTQNATKLLF